MTVLRFPAQPRITEAPAQDERPIVDVTACLEGYRVWVRGRPFHDFATLSNAARCGAALMTLEALGLLERITLQPTVRQMLEASVKAINPEPEPAA